MAEPLRRIYVAVQESGGRSEGQQSKKIRSDTMTTASLLVRLYNALIESRMRAAMREIARHPHVRLPEPVKALDLIPRDEVKRAGYQATYADAGMLPFVRGA
jgi:hypothetical protein